MNNKPSLYQRARVAYEVFRTGKPPRTTLKSAPFAWPTWIDGKPKWQIYDYASYVEEGFDINSVIYSCIMFKVRQIGMSPLKAWMGDPEKPEPAPPDHRVSRLVSRPNPYQSMMEFQQQNTVYLNLSGNVYIMLDRAKPNDYPQAMYTLRPDRVRIIPGKGGVLGYAYKIEGKSENEVIPILPQNMMHVKLPAGMDELEGMGEGLSPIAPLARSGDVDNSVSNFLKNFFDKGTQAFGFLEVEETLDPATIARLRDEWDEMYGGNENWGRPVVLDSGAKWNRGNTNFAEMGFMEIDERNETRIHGPFGVPPILTGMRVGLNRSTFSNYEEARKACWEDTLNPELDLYEVDYQYYLNDGDVFVKHDKSKVPALRKNYKEMAEAAEVMIRNGVPPNKAFYLVGLDVGEIEGGDVSYFPMTLAPMSMAGTSLLPPPTQNDTMDGAPQADDEERIQAAARALVDIHLKKNRSLPG